MTSIGILLFDGCDLLDVGGPYEVFLTADRLVRRKAESGVFDVHTVSPDGKPVTSYGGMGLTPHYSASERHDFDVIVIPGAIDMQTPLSHQPTVETAVALAKSASIISSVCTGAFLLGKLGLLDSVAWTTHHEDVEILARQIDSDRGRAFLRWVDEGRVVTSGGLSAGIAMALHLVDRLHSTDLAIKTAHQLEYAWDPHDS